MPKPFTSLTEELEAFAKARAEAQSSCEICALPPEITEALNSCYRKVKQPAMLAFLQKKGVSHITRHKLARHFDRGHHAEG